MITVRAVITSELAQTVSYLAAQHQESSVEVRYDTDRDERLWEVVFEDVGNPIAEYVVDDETGDVIDPTRIYGIDIRKPALTREAAKVFLDYLDAFTSDDEDIAVNGMDARNRERFLGTFTRTEAHA